RLRQSNGWRRLTLAWVRRWVAFSTNGWGLVALTVAFLVFQWRFGVGSQAYAPPDAVPGPPAVLPPALSGAVAQWGPDKARAFVATLLRLDFAFPIVYASLFYGLYVWLSRKLNSATHRSLEWVPWVAALFDWIENLVQIRLVHQALAGDTG